MEFKTFKECIKDCLPNFGKGALTVLFGKIVESIFFS